MAKRRSKRREQILAEQRARRRKQALTIGSISIGIILILGGLLWAANRPRQADSYITSVVREKAWGPQEAPVLVEEYSDFN